MKVSSRTILITGGSKGIGFALAKEFHKLQNKVIICGRNMEQLEKAKNKLGDIEIIQCDLSKDSDLLDLVDKVRTSYGDLSLLINNAGVQLCYDFTEVNIESALEKIDWELKINLNSLIKLNLLLLPLLQKSSSGGIVNISSGLAIVPKKSAPVYCASKAAVHIFSQALRYQVEDQHTNISVFEAMIPLVETDMTKGRGRGKISPEQVVKEIVHAIVKNRFEIYVGKAKLLVWINRFFPGIAKKIMRDI